MIVVKVGGSLIREGAIEGVLEDAALLAKGSPLILVHGGGALVTDVAQRLGLEQKFITSPSGIRSRYTDRETAEVFAMVMAGKINSNLVASLRARGIDAFGLSGLDGGLLLAERKKRLLVVDERGRKRAIDGGYTGKILSVNSRVLDMLLAGGFTPVISPVAAGTEGEMLNVDADRAAAMIASAVRADKLILLTNVKGLLDERGELVRELTVDEARDYMKRVGPGMDKKLLAAVEALEGGVGEALIASGRAEHPVGDALKGEDRTAVRRP